MKRILVTPLDWGLGHATRCIPIIRELLKRECKVLIAGSGDSLLLLKNEFPHLTCLALPGYHPVYPSGENMVLKMGIQVPKFINVINKEHRYVESIIEEHAIDLVISDNRYGCWSAKIPSVFMTHQLNILMPKGWGWLSRLVGFLNKRLIKKFSFCWIPDYADPERSLSGTLSKATKYEVEHITHIGPLSRFSPKCDSSSRFDVLCIFSGPEPQRSIFEKKVNEQLGNSGLRYFVTRGVLSQKLSSQDNEVDFLNSEALQTVISQSSLVIARSGYSTIMDLAALGKKAILVPTPGQTEQEYLADRWKEKGVLYSMPQHNFDLGIAIKESEFYTGFKIDPRPVSAQFVHALNELLDKI
jgi:uncharacterized protein (TIGR00661 family)